MFTKLTNKWSLGLMGCLLAASVVLASCSNAAPTTPPASTTTTPPSTTTTPPPTSTTASGPVIPTPVSGTTLTGAGSTFAQPLYTKWADPYAAATGVKINYQGVGSGAGIQQVTAGTVDFGASDAIMTADQEAAAVAAHGPILHIPTTSGGVAVIYNLPGIAAGQLKLTGDVLANIYLKKITTWNDPAITALNPGLNLPSTAIAVVHRSDGSGTTYIFTNYLSKVSSEWNTKVGSATSVNWPGDVGGQGSAGVAGQVQQIPGAIGYDELAYAIQNNLPFAQMQNSSGKFLAPNVQDCAAATVGVTLPADMKVMITNSTNPDAYPIVGFTWILAFVNQTDQAKGTALVNFLWWGIHDGQQYTSPLLYVPLSPDAVKIVEKEIEQISYQGQPLIK